MKNTLEFVVAIIVIIILVGAMFFMKPLDVVDNTPSNSGDKIIEDVYIPFEKITPEYSMTRAIEEGTFVIDKSGNTYNQDSLEEFLKIVRNNQSGDIRIVQEEMSGDIQIMEIKHDNEKIVVKYRAVDSQIIQNEYLKAEGYSINSTTTLTNDGKWWNGCYISKDEKDEIVLLGYQVKQNDEFSGEKLTSGEIVENVAASAEME